MVVGPALGWRALDLIGSGYIMKVRLTGVFARSAISKRHGVAIVLGRWDSPGLSDPVQPH